MNAHQDVPTQQTDAEFVKMLQAKGYTVIDGRRESSVPELNLECIHDQIGLRHLGGGDFENVTYSFDRWDSPSTTRFYVRRER